jgi:hypothetical protein
MADDGARRPQEVDEDQLAALPGLLDGAELAAARLIIASAGLDLVAVGQRRKATGV